ncbi:MAG TPA: ABC transporter ATP-binding protein [Chloroflexi bacterium]|nr:ABC transporter ATP-binding protein [Chloroflexota bacterium]
MKAFRRLFVFVKPYWYWAILAPLLMTLEVMMDLYQPRLLATIIDSGILPRDLEVVKATGLRMIGLAFIGALGGFGCTVTSVLAAYGYGTDLRDALYRKVMSLSFANIDKLQTGRLVTRLTNDVTQVQNAVMMLLRMMVRAPLLLLGSIVMAITTGPRLAPLFIVLLPLVLAVIAMVINKVFPMFKEVQARLDDLNTVMQENLMGVRVVKAFVREEHEMRRFADVNEKLMALAIKAGRIGAVGFPTVMFLLNMGVIAVLWFGGNLVVDGSMQVGEVIAFTNYLMRTLMSTITVSMLVLNFSRAEASADRILEIMDAEPTVLNQPDAAVDVPTRDRLRFEHVMFAYDGDDPTPVLKDLDFEVAPGQTVAILGATGSGKSTLVHLIPRFYDVQAGRVRFGDLDVRDADKHALRRRVTIAFQEPVLFSGTIKDNIRYGRPDATDEEVENAARIAQAHDFIMGFPEGYETEVGQRGVNLSGGQKQRIAIARALVMDPDVLILDDSTSSVDVDTEAKIQEGLANYARERTTFIIAQRISSVLTADKILVLEHGRISAMGTHDELIESSPVYQEIFASQLGNGGVNHA